MDANSYLNPVILSIGDICIEFIDRLGIHLIKICIKLKPLALHYSVCNPPINMHLRVNKKSVLWKGAPTLFIILIISSLTLN